MHSGTCENVQPIKIPFDVGMPAMEQRRDAPHDRESYELLVHELLRGIGGESKREIHEALMEDFNALAYWRNR